MRVPEAAGRLALRLTRALQVHPWHYLEGGTGIEELRYDNAVDFITEVNAVVKASGPHLQGVLNLRDNRDADGGTQLVPGFHRRFEEWVAQLGAAEENRDERALVRGWLVPRAQGGGSFKFPPGDAVHGLAHRISSRAGSLIVWNQQLASSRATRPTLGPAHVPPYAGARICPEHEREVAGRPVYQGVSCRRHEQGARRRSQRCRAPPYRSGGAAACRDGAWEKGVWNRRARRVGARSLQPVPREQLLRDGDRPLRRPARRVPTAGGLSKVQFARDDALGQVPPVQAMVCSDASPRVGRPRIGRVGDGFAARPRLESAVLVGDAPAVGVKAAPALRFAQARDVVRPCGGGVHTVRGEANGVACEIGPPCDGGERALLGRGRRRSSGDVDGRLVDEALDPAATSHERRRGREEGRRTSSSKSR